MADGKKPINGEFYRDFKGNIYQVKMLAKDSSSGTEVVVYQGMYPPYQCWVRSLEEFLEKLDTVQYPDALQEHRFEKICAEELVQKAEPGQMEDSQNPPKVLGQEVQDRELLKALKSGQPERYLKGKLSENDIAMRGFMQLLDAKTFQEKRQIFIGLKQYLDKHMLSNISVALDIALEEGSREQQYESILRCLEAFEHYEGGRLR